MGFGVYSSTHRNSPLPPPIWAHVRGLCWSPKIIYTFGLCLLSWERYSGEGNPRNARSISQKIREFWRVCLYSLAWVKECGTTARPCMRSSPGFLVDQLPNNYDNYTAIQLQGIVQKVKDPIFSCSGLCSEERRMSIVMTVF